jgi:hypothetical protein
MTTIDIPLPDALTNALKQPICLDLQLPKPKVDLSKLTLPTGGAIKGMADFTRGIPTDCSMNFSLMLQIAPIMASMECLLKVLKFIGGMVDAAKSANPVKLLSAIVSGAEDLASCLAMVTPAGMFCFVKALLELIASMLLCTVQALSSIVNILDGISLDMLSAQRSGNDQQLAALQCAQENAQIAAESTMKSLEPILVLLELAKPFMEIAGISLNVTIPSGIPTDGLDGLKKMLTTLGQVAQAIKTVADAIPC